MLIFNSWHTAGKSNIYTVDDDGAHLQCLTSGCKLLNYNRLRISPRHDRLLFTANLPRQETGQFFFWDFDANKLHVYRQELYPFDMRWLRNDRLLCIRKGKYWIVDLATSETIDLDFLDFYLAMDIAPDGDRIFLTQSMGVGGSFYVGYIQQRQVHEIFHPGDYENSSPILYPYSWSPDGQTIACVGGYEDEFWLMDADGFNPRKAVESDYFWLEMKWSPDSQKFGFTRGLDGKGPSTKFAGVFIKDLQSGEEKQVIRLHRAETWVWGADGQSLVFSQKNEDSFSLLRLNIQTGDVVEIIGPGAGIKGISELIVI